MSMSTRVTGVRDLDKRFRQMIDVKLACETAKVNYPQDVEDYFSTPGESEGYLREEMETIDIKDAVKEEVWDGSDSWLVSLDKLPDDVKAIRFTNSY